MTLSEYVDNGLINGTEYFYVVRAVDTSLNESTDSNEAYAIPMVNLGSGLEFTTASGSYVTFGDPAKLDLGTFTIETWFKRTGAGTSITTGTNGIPNAIPLVAHGAQQSEGGTVDANWMLVIDDATDVIAADFEDMVDGTNHPVYGVTPITNDVWHHAAATYDGTTWKLYLDGYLEMTLVVGAAPRSDTIQHASLGTMLNTTGGTNGFFQGVIDEPRVWNRALTQTEILTNINEQITSGTGLVARWGLNEGTGTAVGDSITPAAIGTITGPNYAWVPGAPFNLDLTPNTPTLVSPANGATGVSTSATLTVNVADARNSDLTVSFYGRPKDAVKGNDFSLIVIPDPQYYAASYPSIYYAQMNWVVANEAALNIPFVISLGDNVDTASSTTQWDVATAAWDILTTGGVPYGLELGNHDGAPSSTGNFNSYFASRLAGPPNSCINYGADYDNTYCTFSASGMDFIVLFIEYDSTMTSTSNPVLIWANNILQANPDRRAIVVTHDLLSGNNFTSQGSAIYNALKENQNLFLMLGGHLDTTGQRIDVYNGYTVYSLRSDYQFVDSQQSGYLRIMRFSPNDGQIHVTTYSPTQSKYLTDTANQFDLAYAMDGVADFAFIGSTTVASGSDASVTWSGLTANTEYEWYAVVDNGGAASVSPTWSFTTEAPVPMHTVTFNANGGSGTMAPQAANVPTALTLNTFTRTGYSFSNWNTAANGSGTSYADGAVYDFSANVTLYAQWTANTYTVTFDANGGSAASPTSKQVTFGSAYGTLATTDRTGYTFNGWFTAASGGTQVTAATIVTTASNHTLYAQWTANTYTVTFDANGGSTPSPTSKQVTFGAAYGTLATTDRTGYTFSGWFTAASGGTQVTAATIVTTASNHTLYAQWSTLPNHTVTFKANGGIGSDYTQTTNTSTSLILNTFTRTGYAFNHWNTASDDSGTTYTNGQIYDFLADMDLYAQWTANAYTVTFDANGGSTPSPELKVVTYDSAYGTLATTDRTGYTFSGWFTAASGGTEVTAATIVSIASNHTLYAQWTANTYTVTFDANGGTTPSPISKVVTYDLAYGMLATTDRTGYTFSGWFTDVSGGTQVTEITIVSTASDHTLYAQWTSVNPVPTIITLSPSSATAGGAAFTLTVYGTNFVNDSVVRWNGSDRTTTFVSTTQLTATITMGDIATVGTYPVTVFNPTPGGGISNAVDFTVMNVLYNTFLPFIFR